MMQVEMALDQGASFHPSVRFAEAANVSSNAIYKEAAEDREGFWASQAKSLSWFKKWDCVLEWNPPFAKWFGGGKINAAYNCLDRHMGTEVRYKTALFWEGERGEARRWTYEDLYFEVCRFANVLKGLGVRKGDKVAIYLPMVPEAVAAMLACARIGAVHTVVFAGFSAEALRDRIVDLEAKILVTADGGFRKGKIVPLKETADLALESCSTIEKAIVLKRTGHPVPMLEGRDFWYGDLMAESSSDCPAEAMDAEDELFVLYTSGTTGKPKGIVHTTAGYLLGVTTTMRWVFDLKPDDVYWCTADIGWITGHSYVVYGPLANGATQLLYEGSPDFPEKNRFWKLIEKYKVSIFYTAPTAIRTFMKWGEEWPEGCDLSTLRLLGSVGEPINPEAWLWYRRIIGADQCPIVDTWWQTETGSILIAPLPGIVPTKPGSATFALPGIDLAILDEEGRPSERGFLAIASPWPSMLRGIHKDPERYVDTYWKKWDGRYYFSGDGAKRDGEGYYWLMGRVDDVINVSGHRLGTMEIESALVGFKGVAEVAAIAVPHELKGQSVVVFVTLQEGETVHRNLEHELKNQVVLKIGAIARPERMIVLSELPKTRSGKIIRRLLRDIAAGRVVGDVTTLSDPAVLADIKRDYANEEE